MKGLRGFFKGQRGLTLMELIVVVAILAVLASLTAVAVTGTTSTAKSSNLVTDVNAVEQAANGFAGTHPKGFFPVELDSDGSQKVETVAASIALLHGFGDGTSSVDVYVIDWDADDLTDADTPKLFSPGYIKEAQHSTDTTDHDNNATSPPIGVWIIIKATSEADVMVLASDY